MNGRPQPPQWYAKAREFAARVRSPLGKPFAAAKTKKCARLYLYDAIGKDPWDGSGIDAKDVVAALDEAKGSDSLEVHINSPGGYIFEGVTVFNAIRSFPGPKTVHVDGIAASIASVIALAGDTVITNEGAMWMIHDPMSGVIVFGSADEIEAESKRTITALRSMRENMLDVYSKATGQARGDLSAWMTAETWMTAAEAKARGFTDEIASGDCGCSCVDCAAGNCAACTDECDTCKADGCPGCMEGMSASAKIVAPPRMLSGAELVANARAQRATAHAQATSLRQRFAGASPAARAPGQPGLTNTTPGNRQEGKKS